MAFEVATLVVASTLHLSGSVSDRAGIAEAIIAVVLAAGTVALVRGRRRAALATIVFAIVGFGVGLSMTAREGAAGPIAYHVTMLPILLYTLVAAWRTPAENRRDPGSIGRVEPTA